MTARTRKLLSSALSYLVLLVASFIALFPVYWTVSTSIKQRDDTFVFPPKFISFEPTLKNYDAIFNTRGFWQTCINTLVITLLSTLLCVAVATLAAYALARSPRFRGGARSRSGWCWCGRFPPSS